VPQASPQASDQAPGPAAEACHLRRLVDFAEPRRDDTCLDVGRGPSALATALRPRVRELTGATAGSLPAGRFTLVTACLALGRSADQTGLVHDLLRVCGGRLVLADLVRTRAGDGGRIERLRDPAQTTMRTVGELLELLRRAGGWTRRLDMFTIERPVEPWLAGARQSERIRRELTDELDGGPPTGARPRLIGGELWFAQSWAFLAVEPVLGPPSPEE
jgi:hypothetical protein